MNYINVLYKLPRFAPKIIRIPNDLRSYQKLVAGHIEVARINEVDAFICNEEGLINDMEYTTSIAGYDLFGPLVGISIDGPEFADWPYSIEETKKKYPELWLLGGRHHEWN